MGGLVCRGLLQNSKLDPGGAAQLVDKVFTYATPHNGIDLLGINPPSWLNLSDISNFNRQRLATFLDLEAAYKLTERVDWLPEARFASKRFFCMVGTNRMDYEAGLGLSRTFAGHGSDGLVRIDNATLCGLDASGKPTAPCAKAFTYRAHSGYFGIVNSEEAYQNLTRFLFGDVRVDIWAEVDAITLPKELRKSESQGQTVNALYQFEVLAAPRGKLWYLSRRTAEEDSVACLAHQHWLKAPQENGKLFLGSLFLADRARVNSRRKGLAYTLTFNVRVPDYEVERKLWVNQHFEGSYLFRNSLVLEITPPSDDSGWQVSHAWQNQGVHSADHKLDGNLQNDGSLEIEVPFDSVSEPGISGRLRFLLARWNHQD